MRQRLASQRRGLHAELIHQLGTRIVAGEIAEGEPLAPDEIGQRFEVSRTVVREALRVLEAKGMVTARPNIGTRVRPITEWNLLDPDIIDWRVHGPPHRSQLRELRELRSAIEPYAARLAAQRMDEGACAALRQACERMRATARGGGLAEFTRADVDFHHALLRASDNRMIEQLQGTVTAALHARGEQLASADNISEEALIGHQRVTDAVTAGDAGAAERAMQDLIAGVGDEAES